MSHGPTRTDTDTGHGPVGTDTDISHGPTRTDTDISHGRTRNDTDAEHALPPGFELVRRQLDTAVAGDSVETIARQVKDVLEDALRGRELQLPVRFATALPDRYARRLLHRDPEGRYTAVVMTWGPAQKTPLHDHAGIWCVECVVDGRMEVTQYDLVSESDGLYRFHPQQRVTAARGSAGCLIPPFEYHTLGNARPDGVSMTLHVYGGEMDQCHVFESAGGGAYRRVTRSLTYHD